jgi:hypothetical protein
MRSAIARLAMAALVLATSAVVTGGCATVRSPVPSCGSFDRLALVAQSVPSASYVPCLTKLPAGWTASGFDASSGRTRFTLTSDRAPGSPVHVTLLPGCDLAGATPTTPRAPGARTYTALRSISPRYAGTLTDVFAGGCVTYEFDFERGPHIALMEEFEGAISLYPRQQLAVEVHRRLGVPIG